MNFVERASDTTSSSPSLPTPEFADIWDAFKMHFSLEDVSHDAPTYYHLTSDVFSPYSHTARLDRYLVPSDALTHPLVLPTVSIPHHSTNFSVAPPIGFRRSFSDHLPVRLAFSSGPSEGARGEPSGATPRGLSKGRPPRAIRALEQKDYVRCC